MRRDCPVLGERGGVDVDCVDEGLVAHRTAEGDRPAGGGDREAVWIGGVVPTAHRAVEGNAAARRDELYVRGDHHGAVVVLVPRGDLVARNGDRRRAARHVQGPNRVVSPRAHGANRDIAVARAKGEVLGVGRARRGDRPANADVAPRARACADLDRAGIQLHGAVVEVDVATDRGQVHPADRDRLVAADRDPALGRNRRIHIQLTARSHV